MIPGDGKQECLYPDAFLDGGVADAVGGRCIDFLHGYVQHLVADIGNLFVGLAHGNAQELFQIIHLNGKLQTVGWFSLLLLQPVHIAAEYLQKTYGVPALEFKDFLQGYVQLVALSHGLSYLADFRIEHDEQSSLCRIEANMLVQIIGSPIYQNLFLHQSGGYLLQLVIVALISSK